MTNTKKRNTIFDLSLDIKYIVLDYLDNRSLAYLAQSCKYFGMLVKNVVSFRNAEISTVDHLMPRPPPFLNYRAGVAIGSTLYMPFINERPFCYAYDLDTNVWTSHELNLINMTDIQPQVTSATAIGTNIYLVGGRLLKSYTLSNGLIEIDTTNFNTRMINDANGMPPRPRHEHSVDSIGNRYLVVFGGLCYNSVGENDVFVYDIFDNRWFVPPISGHVPHLRFGHASAVIGHILYIHGGAQLDNDSSYIVYDDLYKLDCQTWVWYKYEHPEVEKYLRNQISTPGESPQRNHLIATTGDNPFDRFQSMMCSFGNKLIVFGGHSIREDEDDNEILCSYSIDELSIFNTKRSTWSVLSATSVNRNKQQSSYMDGKENDAISDDLNRNANGNANGNADGAVDETITVSDMSIATVPMGSRGLRVYVFAGRKAAEIPRSTKPRNLERSTSSNASSQSHQMQDGHHHNLPSIAEISSSNRINNDKTNEPTESGESLPESEKSKSSETEQGEVRTPNESDHSEQVKQLFQLEPDLDDVEMEEDDSMLSNKSKLDNTINSKSKKKYNRRKRPSISVIHHDHTDESSGNADFLKNTSSSDHSSLSSNGSLGIRNSRHFKKVTPCTILLDLIE